MLQSTLPVAIQVDWYAKHGAEFLKDTEYPPLPGFSKSFVTYQPLGPWDSTVFDGWDSVWCRAYLHGFAMDVVDGWLTIMKHLKTSASPIISHQWVRNIFFCDHQFWRVSNFFFCDAFFNAFTGLPLSTQASNKMGLLTAWISPSHGFSVFSWFGMVYSHKLAGAHPLLSQNWWVRNCSSRMTRRFCSASLTRTVDMFMNLNVYPLKRLNSASKSYVNTYHSSNCFGGSLWAGSWGISHGIVIWVGINHPKKSVDEHLNSSTSLVIWRMWTAGVQGLDTQPSHSETAMTLNWSAKRSSWLTIAHDQPLINLLRPLINLNWGYIKAMICIRYPQSRINFHLVGAQQCLVHS